MVLWSNNTNFEVTDNNCFYNNIKLDEFKFNYIDDRWLPLMQKNSVIVKNKKDTLSE